GPSPASVGGAGRNLLLGMIALQNNFITREALVAAFDAWVQDKSRPLAAILENRQALSGEDCEILERLVQQLLDKQGGDAEKSLAALSPVPEVRRDLDRLGDPDLEATLAYVGRDGAGADSATLHCDNPGLVDCRFRILRPHAQGGLGQVSVALDQ